MICTLCPRACDISEGQTGFCGARSNSGGEIICSNYGRITSMSLDPIEKKPLKYFMPGSRILSVGSYGCNFICPFCQNHAISACRTKNSSRFISPKQLVAEAVRMKSMGNIGLAFTYNEPLIGYEFVRDCCELARQAQQKTVIVTNGCINEEPFTELLPLVDAMNIDLKSYSERFYKAVGGDLATVRRSIELAAATCHLEVTTLIIPGFNDSDGEMEQIAGFIASVDRTVPLHITRFFPRYKLSDCEPTPKEALYRLAHVAGRKLDRVHIGNV